MARQHGDTVSVLGITVQLASGQSVTLYSRDGGKTFLTEQLESGTWERYQTLELSSLDGFTTQPTVGSKILLVNLVTALDNGIVKRVEAETSDPSAQFFTLRVVFSTARGRYTGVISGQVTSAGLVNVILPRDTDIATTRR